MHRFLFLGFPPPKREKTRKLLLSLAEEEATLIFYLPLRRMAEFLGLAEETLGDREVVVARELTKVYEQFIRGTLGGLRDDIGERKLKGEATVLIRGRQRRRSGQDGV
jgi:16S rRNA (cytidine1402-2'-O)-methyltransferase